MAFNKKHYLQDVDPNSVQFLLFSSEDIRRLSVAKIVTPNSFDSLGHPTPGGVYDPALGPIRDKADLCITCGNGSLFCPGHFGHIDLPLTVVNPMFFKIIYTLFRMSCIKCHRMQISDEIKLIITLQLELLDAGLITAALDLDNFIGDLAKKGNDDVSFKDKLRKKYSKLLSKQDNVTKTFQNKNTGVLRNKFITALYKNVSMTKCCKYCNQRIIKITTSDNKFMYNAGVDGGIGIKTMMADEIKKHCTAIWNNDKEFLAKMVPVLQYVNVEPATDILFMDIVPVPPPVIRPCNVLRGELIEHPQSVMYKAIIQVAFAARTILMVVTSDDREQAIDKLPQEARSAYSGVHGTDPAEKFHNVWQDLQKSVNQILNSENIQWQGLKQIIEKKSGVIRQHMMGKRVNYAARSVITPDPNVAIDEIGLPEAFAMKLTYPVPVTAWNVDELRKMVINGPGKHPGAEMLELEDGRKIRIPADSIDKRKSLAKRLLTPDESNTGLKKVHRHLLNGDILLLNRQPTLHKPSIMAHRARILKGEKTLRLHYANCKAYNADFDGDEMNAHYPQNEIARSEAYNIMSVCKQYLVPKDGTPLSGLIQDHVISGVKMSMRGNFFTKEDYQQLVFQALSYFRGDIKLLPPTILKPVTLWSGKQILSTIILNSIPKGKPYLSLMGKAKISSKAWQLNKPRPWVAGGTPFADPNTMSEAEVIIRDGELLSGVLDKTHYGATPYGLVHCMYELYGGVSSSALLSSFSKVLTFYLQWEGFTLGVRDILVVDEGNEKRDDVIRMVRQVGNVAAAQAAELPVDVDDNKLRMTLEELTTKNPKFRASLDRQYKSVLDQYTNSINNACLSEGLLSKFPDNNLQLMVQSGAKGSTVNTMQISCLLGQIELEGKRPPVMISGRSLPSFPPYDVSPRAGGFIDGRFMTGILPQEFFFHCMAGREGLIDTAVKTSRSGYLQRCLIKHLEGISVGYDMTVRDSDSSIIQFAYGEDGLDVCKSQFLRKEQMSFLDINSKALVSKHVIKKLKSEGDTEDIQKMQKKLKRYLKKNGDPFRKVRTSGFTEFSKIAKEDIEIESVSDFEPARDKLYVPLLKSWQALKETERDSYMRKRCPDPILSKTSPEFKFGVINEQLNNLMQDYLKKRSKNSNEHEQIIIEKDNFLDILNAKILLSMAAPGEPVGLLAAQSIGEPSTQMTLNTFHFAGRGDMNVTLGIPRLREILMTASANLKTPNMDIPFRQDLPNLNKTAEKLRKGLNKVTVEDLLEKIEVKCETCTNSNRQLKCILKFIFLPHKQYKTQYIIKPKQVIRHMQKKFFGEMFSTIKKLAKINCGMAWTSEKDTLRKQRKGKDDDDEDEPVESKEAGQNHGADDDSSEDEEENADDDTTQVAIRKNRTEGQEYEDPESEEEEKSDEEIENQEKDDDIEIITEENTQTEKTAGQEKITSEVVDTFQSATNYTFDSNDHRWCELTVLFPIHFLRIDLTQALRDAARKSIIHEVKHIKRAITIKNKDTLLIKTEGINIIHMFNYHDTLDLNKLYSNDIHAIANTFGIEAACKVIIKEIQGVFNVYGIQVDPRHLSLISDYMTYNGKFEPMSRKGMESSTSPLQQMSFESSLVFLKDAIINGKTDSLTSASSCLMLGQPCRSGTGCFSLFKAL